MAQSPENNLLVRSEPPLAWLIVNRPEARNALTVAMWKDLAEKMRELSDDAEIRVVILTGAGDNSFIAGADIADLKAALEKIENEKENYRFTLEAIRSLIESSKPVIAMINGHCMGGGMLLAISCDLRFASETARFGIPASKLGVAYPPEQGTARLVRIVGATAASDILLSGRTLDATEALRIGLVNRILPQLELEDVTRAYALQLAENAPLSLTAHKLAIAESLLPCAEQNYKKIEEAVDRCYASDDCREGLRAFLEKRAPKFKGR